MFELNSFINLHTAPASNFAETQTGNLGSRIGFHHCF